MNLRIFFCRFGLAVKPFYRILNALVICVLTLLPNRAWSDDPPVPFRTTPVTCFSCERFNVFNTLVRDGKIARRPARTELKQLLAEVRDEYYKGGGTDFLKDSWVFPLAGYTSRAITGGRRKGYNARGYDFFSGNRHGGHPSFDIFIRDRNQDSLDDRSGLPVEVLSLTGGIVVALEQEWKPGSKLRGGNYLWIYDPANDLLAYYAHNAELFVKTGDIVKPGDLLANVGRSGYNAFKHRSPSHLHLTVLKLRDGKPLPLNVYSDLTRAGTAALL